MFPGSFQAFPGVSRRFQAFPGVSSFQAFPGPKKCTLTAYIAHQTVIQTDSSQLKPIQFEIHGPRNKRNRYIFSHNSLFDIFECTRVKC